MNRTIRAKFWCNKVEYTGNSEQVYLSAVYGTDDKDNEENNQFSQATPAGDLYMVIDNPGAQNFIQEGKQYYLDITQADGEV